jgi:cytochrome c-type biogenesis protein CcmH
VNGGSRRARRRRSVWAALGVVLVVALVLGAHRGGGPVGPSQRAAAIDAALRCPSCDGISVAQSSASTAVAIRQTVAERVRAGESDVRIEQFLVSKYGPSLLLRPSTSGAEGLVWLVPVLVGAAALAGVGSVLWRRRRTDVVEVSADDDASVRRALSGDLDPVAAGVASDRSSSAAP